MVRPAASAGKVGPQSKYRPHYDDKYRKHLAAGHSKESFAGVLRISPRTIANWRTAFSSFREAEEIGLAQGLVKFERVWIGWMTDPKKKCPNIVAAIFWAKNHYGWRDRPDTSQSQEPLREIRVVYADDWRAPSSD